MFNLFKKKEEVEETDPKDLWNSDNVKVYYEGEVLSPDYARYTLVFPNDGSNIREDFNEQPKESYHMLCPHGKGKIQYFDTQLEDDDDEYAGLLEMYEGEFDGGQYHGQGKLIFRTGEILEGEFENNKFIGKLKADQEKGSVRG